MKAIATAVAAAFCSLLATTPLGAQGEAGAPRWSGAFYYDVTRIAPSPNEAYWQTVTAGVTRLLDGGSVGIQALASRRFDTTDEAAIFDVYHDLWSGAYGNLRLAAAPGAEVLAQVDAGAELFQSFGNAELAGSFRYQSFEVTEVSTIGAAVGYYLGRWYLRPRTLVANVDESWSPFVAFTARRYFGDSGDNRVDLSLGMGEEVLEVAAPSSGAGPLDVITSGSRFLGVRGQRYLNGSLGLSLGASYSDYAEIPNRWGASLGVMTRW